MIVTKKICDGCGKWPPEITPILTDCRVDFVDWVYAEPACLKARSCATEYWRVVYCPDCWKKMNRSGEGMNGYIEGTDPSRCAPSAIRRNVAALMTLLPEWSFVEYPENGVWRVTNKYGRAVDISSDLICMGDHDDIVEVLNK